MTFKHKFFQIAAVSLYCLAGCDWVDSTGTQGDTPSQPVALLDEGMVIRLVEGESRTLDPGESLAPAGSGQVLSWDETPLQQGRLPGCASVADYAADIATNSLRDACYDATACELYFEPVTVNGDSGQRVVFNLLAPVLKAPVGITYQLIASGPQGMTAQTSYTFCLVAENEAPVANDDIYPVVENETLTISAAGLLTNDTDDTDSDVRNQPLRVVLPALSEPTLAEFYELFVDGSFTYTPSASVTLSPGVTQTDVFEYEITDGTHTDSAKVLINIVAADAAPQLLEPIAQSIAIVGIHKAISLSEYFSDPEGGELAYVIDAASLPPSNSFVLGAAGILSGTAEPLDVGDWTVIVSATDVNGQSVVSDFLLSVVDNLPPESLTIPSQSADVGELFRLDTSRFFTDAEGISLSYTLTGGDTASIAIDRFSGVISGFFSVAEVYELTVSVSDGVNLPVSETFVTVVTSQPNQPPTYSGLIRNQSVELGQPIMTIQGDFRDPDGDVLAFSMLGILPPGVTLAAASGLVSGTPIKLGVYRNLRIIATDPDGETARSDNFTITVTAAVLNRKPVYSGQLVNQTITLGSAIGTIEGNFSDPDGDLLNFSVIGVLPAGIGVDKETGVVSGIPSLRGTYANLRIRATDVDGLFAVSERFTINVR